MWIPKRIQHTIHTFIFNPLSANPTKWPNTLKQFVGKLRTNCLSVFDHFVKLALKGLIKTCGKPLAKVGQNFTNNGGTEIVLIGLPKEFYTNHQVCILILLTRDNSESELNLRLS